MQNHCCYFNRDNIFRSIGSYLVVKNNSINNKETSSAKNLNHQDLSEEIKKEKGQSYDVWNRDNTTILYLSGLQRRKQSDYQADIVENMNGKKFVRNLC